LEAADYYSVLSISRDADEAAIKTAFRQRARGVHPDKNSSPLADEAFKRLQRVQDVLLDGTVRRRYDATGEEEETKHVYRDAPPANTWLLPGVISIVMSMIFGLSHQFEQGSPGSRAQHKGVHDRHRARPRGPAPTSKKTDEEVLIHLEKSNADAACGVPGQSLCVVLVRKLGHDAGNVEENLIKDLRKKAAARVRNSRGQSVVLNWAMTAATGKWPSLLPPGATLPWVVVLKASRRGLSTVAMPVPASGGRTKGRLTQGVPPFLQDAFVGTARFERFKGNVSALYQR